MNAFNSVRPRGTEAPSKAPKRQTRSRAPMQGHLRNLPEIELHDESESRIKYAKTVAELEKKFAESGRASRCGTYRTPAERARIADNEFKREK